MTSLTNKPILLCLAHMSGNETKYIQEAFNTNWVAPLGPNVNEFEAALEAYIGEDKHLAALTTGTAAIHLALVASDIQPGDEVICQSFTFSASCNPVTYVGAVPVFVDSEADTWNMDPQLLEQAIADRIKKTGKKPRAIIPVHLFGMPARMSEIMDIANHYDIPVIEDAAEAFGSRYKKQACGTFGRYGVLSFNGNKMITTSGGGALICPDEEAKKRIVYLATQARQPKPYYLHTEIGYNYRMSNICAGIGRGQMTVADDHIAHHRRICACYQELLSDTENINVHVQPSADFDSNYWLTTIILEDVSTEAVRLRLADESIESRPLWKPMHTQPVYKNAQKYTNGVSESLFSKGLCLPSGPCVSETDCERIVEIIKSCI